MLLWQKWENISAIFSFFVTLKKSAFLKVEPFAGVSDGPRCHLLSAAQRVRVCAREQVDLICALTLLTLNQLTGPNLPLPAQSKHRRVKGPTVALMSLPSPFMHSRSLFRSYWAHRLKICPLRSSSPSSSHISLHLCSSVLSLHWKCAKNLCTIKGFFLSLGWNVPCPPPLQFERRWWDSGASLLLHEHFYICGA